MRLQVIVSTMFQTDHSLLDRMNIQSDAIVINQCDRNEIEIFEYRGHCIKWYSLAERGVGLSRNTALQRADADVLIFADDDVAYCDGYADVVVNFFKKNKNISLATFNLQSQNRERPEYIDTKTHNIHLYNCLKYGAFRIAVRREAILASNITYSLLFGGGAKYQAGEDNLFITDCLKCGLRAKASPDMLGTVKQEQSTWFSGYNEKYYIDRGALFRAMYKRAALPMLLFFELKNIHRKNKFCFFDRFMLASRGIKNFDKSKGLYVE